MMNNFAQFSKKVKRKLCKKYFDLIISLSSVAGTRLVSARDWPTHAKGSSLAKVTKTIAGRVIKKHFAARTERVILSMRHLSPMNLERLLSGRLAVLLTFCRFPVSRLCLRANIAHLMILMLFHCNPKVSRLSHSFENIFGKFTFSLTKKKEESPIFRANISAASEHSCSTCLFIPFIVSYERGRFARFFVCRDDFPHELSHHIMLLFTSRTFLVFIPSEQNRIYFSATFPCFRQKSRPFSRSRDVYQCNKAAVISDMCMWVAEQVRLPKMLNGIMKIFVSSLFWRICSFGGWEWCGCGAEQRRAWSGMGELCGFPLLVTTRHKYCVKNSLPESKFSTGFIFKWKLRRKRLMIRERFHLRPTHAA